MPDNKPVFSEFRRERFTVSTDPARLDVEFIHGFLARKSYWANGIPREVVAKALRHSLSFGLYDGAKQIGLARVITDQATYAYLCDVFVDAVYRGQGLGTWLLECVMAHPALPGLRRLTLATRDAHELYRKFGFAEPIEPQNLMEIRRPNVYEKGAVQAKSPSKRAGTVGH